MLRLKSNLVIEKKILAKIADGLNDTMNEFAFNKLLPEYFTKKIHQDAFKVAQSAYFNQESFDALTLEGKINQSDDDLRLFFADLVGTMYNNLYQFSEQELCTLIEIHDFNQALIKLNKTIKLIENHQGTQDDLKLIKSQLHDIINENVSHQKTGSRLTDIVDAYHNCDEKEILIKTGIKNLDAYLNGGFEKGTVLSLVAEPGVGKTYYGMYLLNEILNENIGTQALFFSIEMTKKNLYKRFISLKAKKFDKLCTQEERDQAAIELKLTNLNVYDAKDEPNCANIDFIRMTSLLESKKIPISAILIDYLSIVQINKTAERDDLRISEAMRLIVELAVQLNCLIIVAVHANRNPQNRNPFDRAPTQYDESSSQASFKSSSYWFGLDKPERHNPNDRRLRDIFVIRATKVRNEGSFYINTYFQNGTFSDVYMPYDPSKFMNESNNYTA